ncbi:MAG: glycosyltransferase family 2 protein [Chitinispirillaceae bacterium]|nr:glycosyltransferase family 2 protein [Chitinispirillaceae bacterium]
MDSRVEPVRLSIVIPVYRGEASIGALVDLLVKELGHDYRLEIVLVNDCSPDRSEEVCIGLFHRHPDTVRFYSLAKNVGEHNAVMAGLNKCTGDWAVIMDDDFQNPVSEVKKLVAYAAAHPFDVVYTRYDRKKHSLFRNLGSRFNDYVATVMLKKPKELYLSSFKAINRFLVNELITYRLPFSYIDGLILRTTSNIGVVTVDHEQRREGRSGYTLKKLVSLWLTMFTNFSILPLRVATGIGFAFAGVGFIIGIQAIVEKLMNPSMPVGYTFMVVIVTVFAGIQLLAIGMAGEYIGRMFLQQNGKPQYTIRTSFESSRLPDA